MNTLSNIFDAALESLGIHVATGCNGHILFVWCVGYSIAAAVFFGRWSWGAFVASAVLGILGNLVRIGFLLPLAGIPCFKQIHDLLGWALSGIVLLVIVECYEPTRETAVWIGRCICVLLVIWAILFSLCQVSPGPDCRVANPEVCPKNPGDFCLDWPAGVPRPRCGRLLALHSAV